MGQGAEFSRFRFKTPIGRAVEKFDTDCYRRNSWLISREYVLYV